MNPIARDILSAVLGEDTATLEHYGMPKRSGRYPWGSGKEPYQHSGDFLSRVESLHKDGFSETEIAEIVGLSTTQLRVQRSLASHERHEMLATQAQDLKNKGYSLNAIAKEMGYANDSSVRSLLNENARSRMNKAQQAAESLKKQVDERGMIDVGTGTEIALGMSKEKMKEALYILELEGYPSYPVGIPQVTNKGKQSNTLVLCPPGTEHKEVYADGFKNVKSLKDYESEDGGDTIREKTFHYPSSMSSDRLAIRYGDEGGTAKDGLIEIRRGVADLDLGKSHYAQARIMVDGKYYLKGMAVYSDNLPEGKDIVFNSNKPKGTPIDKALKKIKSDPENPFGSLIKEKGGQSWYEDPKTGEKKLSLINKRAEEGDWGEWGDHLPSQFLSKQPLNLAKRQLGLSIADREAEFKEICSVTNPTVKKALLQSFSDDCDAAAVHLKAAALPRQKYQVILPLTSIKDNEVYAPNYKPGEQVALVRYPHGGTFEIPILTVTHKNKEGKGIMGSNPMDAVGINAKVAERLSGADFDGDTVMVIPTGGRININSTKPLKGLEGFDPKFTYGADSVKKGSDGEDHYYRNGHEYKLMHNTQNEMGRISNLITDMTLKGAPTDQIAAAVRHSMVVIDAEKHHLDYKKSEIDNNIAGLKKTWQGSYDSEGKFHTGASTLISRAKSEEDVAKRHGSGKINDPSKPWYDPSRPEGSLVYRTNKEAYIDPETGRTKFKLRVNRPGEPWYDPSKPEGSTIYRDPEEYYIDPKTGKPKQRMQKSTKMAETDDARTLVSEDDNPMENLYASYANRVKKLGNDARKEIMATGEITYNREAHSKYKDEVDHLNAQLKVAQLNAPKERQAQAIANSVVFAKKQENPDLSLRENSKELKKIEQQALSKARVQVGAQRHEITISDKEWEAIQSGAVSPNTLSQILKHTNVDNLREKATPRKVRELSASKLSKMEHMKANDYSNFEIAQALGVSVSTVNKYVSKGEE